MPLLKFCSSSHVLASAGLVTCLLAPAALAALPPSNTAHRHARSASATSRALPLTARQQAQQLLNRFTFGARPGDVDRVLAVGPSAWLDQQLNPGTLPDQAYTARLADYPTLTLSPQQALELFPDRNLLRQIANGKLSMPSNPDLRAVYEVQLLKFQRREAKREAKAEQAAAVPGAADTATSHQPLTSKSLNGQSSFVAQEKAAGDEEDLTLVERRDAQASATAQAAHLLTLPPEQRMPAILRLPVAERAAVTTFTLGEQRAALLKGFTPRERDLFLSMGGAPGNTQRLVEELSESTVLRDILSTRQLQAVMTDFWFNHFNVYSGKESDRWYLTSYVRDSIEPHALGHFHDLLLATATSPAMLVYLDNWLSVGPDSLAGEVTPRNPKGKKAAKGLNENYGREIMELHTLSVDGGYTQADVTALSSILTGWTVDRPQLGGPFQFDQRRHEPGPKQWLGHTIAEGKHPDGSADGMKEGLEALDLLARSPATAHFISTLLAQRFVADTPPAALVSRLTATFLSTDGDISAMLRTIAASPEFNSRPFFRNKVKTPLEFVASTFRSTSTDPASPGTLVATLRTMGMPLYGAQPPTGYYLTADHWMNSAALLDRFNFADAFTSGRLPGQRFDSSRLLASALLSENPEFLTRNGTAKTPARTPQNPTEPRLSPAVAHPFSPVLEGPKTSASGLAIASEVTQTALLGQPASAATERVLEQQIHPSAQPAPDTLNLLDRFLLSAPDFQLK